LFVSGKRKWRYVGVTHEYITCDGPKRFSNLDSFTFDHKCDGGNRDDKFERDIRLLEKGLKENPKNVRYMFYLAQSNKDLSRYDEAIKWYQKRAEAGGWVEEVYYSYYQIGMCKLRRGDSFDDFKDDLLKAYNYHPKRLEALHYLINFCRHSKRFDLGYKYGMKAINNTYPTNDLLFIDKNVHEWGFWDELAICAHFAGHHKKAIEIYKKLFDENKITDAQMPRFQTNLKFFKKSYEEKIRKKFSDEQNSTRLGVIIVNMGNKIATDILVDRVSQTNIDHDIIVVDNGNATGQISANTTLRLGNKMNITAAWSMGLEYANMLAKTTRKRYLAYCFTSSATEIVSDGDILHSLQQTLKNDMSVVGVHPSLTSDSHKTFKYMRHRSESDTDKISHFDNIFSCYRSSWLDKSGSLSVYFTS